MAKKKNMHWGGIAFLVGLVLAIIIAVLSSVSNSVANQYWPYLTLGLLGIVVGIMNVAESEKVSFMISGIALLFTIELLGTIISTVLGGWVGILYFSDLLISFIAPAVAMVGLLSLFSIAKK